MRKEISKVVRPKIRRYLGSKGFLKAHQVLCPSGWEAFKKPLREGLFGYVTLVIHDSEDEFTLEIGVSPSEAGFSKASYGSPTELNENGATRFRIFSLWRQSGCDHWWSFFPRRDPADWDAPIPPVQVALDKADVVFADFSKCFDDYVESYFGRFL